VARVAELQAASIPPHTAVKTTVRLHQKKDVLTPPPVTTNPGQTASLELVRDFRYPTDFNLPNAPKEKVAKARLENKGAFPVTPATPKEFANRPTGVQLTITPRFEGGLVVLKGELTVTEFDGFTQAVGEVVGRPIINSKEQPFILTANITQAPMMREAHTPIFVTALPGKTYTMKVAGAHDTMLVDFTCELAPEKK
jgi:general secretion pathway protein D